MSRVFVLGLSVVFNYFVLNTQAYPELYLSERSHPHPLVRGVYVMQFIMDTLPANLQANFQLNMPIVLQEALLLSEQALAGDHFNPAMHFAGMFLGQAGPIEEYINEIIGEINNQSQFCMSQYRAGLLPE